MAIGTNRWDVDRSAYFETIIIIINTINIQSLLLLLLFLNKLNN